MTKFFLLVSAVLIPANFLFAAVRVAPAGGYRPTAGIIPDRFATSSETSRQEWGCPVSEVVQARNAAEAMGKIEGECKAQVRRAAAGKPEVLDVIQTSVIWPDVNVTEADGGYYLNGTFFLETVVLHRLSLGE